jgi:PEGA domain-containing protein
MLSSVRAHRESRPSDSDGAPAVGPESAKRRWFSGLKVIFGSKPPEGPVVDQNTVTDQNTNALLAFPSETALRTAPVPSSAAPIATVLPASSPVPSASAGVTVVTAKPASRKGLAFVIVGLAACLAIAGVGLFAVRALPLRSLAGLEPRPGNLTVQTRPDVSEVLVDGERRGVTPLTLSLAPGAHTLTVRSGSDERVVPLTIVAGTEVTQHFEMRTPEPVALFGRVSVATDPPGAHVAVDGRPRGISPVVVTDLTAEEHTVAVTNDGGSAERKIVVAAGGTASVMFSLAKASGPFGGWVSISAPFDVDVAENNDILGSSGTTRIMLAAGRHDVVLTNRSIGYRESRKIEVIAGKTTAIRIEPPRVAISVNARPWAEILMDGASIGQTPIANILVAVGSHELVFRHPQFPERKQTVVVTINGPNRIAADLTK